MKGSDWISTHFIQEVLAKVDIVTLVDARVPLKKMGANYTACCPFHQEKTPSFSVNQPKQFYHCFGCGSSGDAIAFLQAFEGTNFVMAVTELAASVGLDMPVSAQGDSDQPLYSLLAKITEYYHQALMEPSGSPALNYLKNRGISAEMIQAFSLGFAPAAWRTLLSRFASEETALEQTGMILRNDQAKIWDRFRNRLMIPIRDLKGRVIGFGGRLIESTESLLTPQSTLTSGPKYLNSPETALFQKRYCLFGLYELLKKQHKISQIIVVEGYMDVIALTQHGIIGALATLGTALTEHHLKKIFHYASNIIFCFDGDKAGQEAARKALQLVLPFMVAGLSIKFVVLPRGQDPDLYIRQQGIVAFQALLTKGQAFSEYFFQLLLEQVTPVSIETRAQFVNVAKPLLSQLPKGVFREMMFNKLSELVNVNRYAVDGGAPSAIRTTYVSYKKTHLTVAPRLPAATQAALLLIKNPELLRVIPDKVPFEKIQAEGMKLLNATIMLLKRDPGLTNQILQEKLIEGGLLQSNDINHPAILLVTKEAIQAAFLESIHTLIAGASRQMSQYLLNLSKSRELSDLEKRQLLKLLNSAKNHFSEEVRFYE